MRIERKDSLAETIATKWQWDGEKHAGSSKTSRDMISTPQHCGTLRTPNLSKTPVWCHHRATAYLTEDSRSNHQMHIICIMSLHTCHVLWSIRSKLFQAFQVWRKSVALFSQLFHLPAACFFISQSANHFGLVAASLKNWQSQWPPWC